MTDSKLSIKGYLAAFVLLALYMVVSSMEYEDQLSAQVDYCERVAAQLHGNFKDIDCEEAQQ